MAVQQTLLWQCVRNAWAKEIVHPRVYSCTEVKTVLCCKHAWVKEMFHPRACPVRLDQLVPTQWRIMSTWLMCSPVNFSIDWMWNYEHVNDESFLSFFMKRAWLIHETWKHVFRAGYELIPSGRISSYLEHPFRDFSSCICTSCVLCVHKSMTKVVHV